MKAMHHEGEVQLVKEGYEYYKHYVRVLLQRRGMIGLWVREKKRGRQRAAVGEKMMSSQMMTRIMMI